MKRKVHNSKNGSSTSIALYSIDSNLHNWPEQEESVKRNMDLTTEQNEISALRCKREAPLALPGPLSLTCGGPGLYYLTWRSPGSISCNRGGAPGKRWALRRVHQVRGGALLPLLASHLLPAVERSATVLEPSRSRCIIGSHARTK